MVRWAVFAVFLTLAATQELTFPLSINFSPEDRPCRQKVGVFNDFGAAYGLNAEYGVNFGWRRAETPFEPIDSDLEYREQAKVYCSQRGFAYMQRGDELGAGPISDVLWEMDGISDGTYTISALVGDPITTEGSFHVIRVNGVTLSGDNVASFPRQRLRQSATIIITSGRIRIDAEGGTNTKLARLYFSYDGPIQTLGPVPLPPLAEKFSVNFLPQSQGECSDELDVTFKDFGLPFDYRTPGVNYGWVDADFFLLSMESQMVSRVESDDCIFGNFVQMQVVGGPTARWMIYPVPDGPWKITATCGDPVGLDSIHTIEVNDVPILGPTAPSFEGEKLVQSGRIDVKGGLVILSAENGGFNTKLSSISFESLSIPTPLPPTPTPIVAPEECIPVPSEFNGAMISTLACEKILKSAPYGLNFRGRGDTVVDMNGLPTGFTMFLPSSAIQGTSYYSAARLEIVPNNGLKMTATPGSVVGTNNNQQNALGVGLDVPSQALSILATWVLPEGLTGRGEKACIYFGLNEGSLSTLCTISAGNQHLISLNIELEDAFIFSTSDVFEVDATTREVALQLQVLPSTTEIVVRYRGVGNLKLLVRTNAPREFFSFDAANQDFRVGTASFTGPLVEDPNDGGLEFLLTKFELFPIAAGEVVDTTPGVDFRTSYINDLPFPTALVFGPDSRLYVTNVDCNITAITLGTDGLSEVNREIYRPLGFRLCLGIEVDPESTTDDVVLWVSHSDNAQNEGDANSGVVTRLSGPDFSTVENVIVGLPRAIANHATNQLHFGEDGRLYFTNGGNTGAGAVDLGSRTFGTRPEQCLSAALLVADVKKPGFSGNCTPPQDITDLDESGIATEQCDNLCDVQVFASGLRNSYDFTWRDSNQLFATDNGLGGPGAVPILDDNWRGGDSCAGPVPIPNVPQYDPGTQDDLLQRIEEGRFYGHPNPARKDCVFFGGNPDGPSATVPRLPISGGQNYSVKNRVYDVGQQPDSRFKEPVISFGRSRSANGIISYKSNAFCSTMYNDLLVTWYSQLDQVRWLHMNSAGEVVDDEPLKRSSLETGAETVMRNPLCLTQNKVGDIFVGEFSGQRVRVLRPIGGQCTRRARSPAPLFSHVDAVGATMGHKIYVFGGGDMEFAGADSDEAYEFDIRLDAWTKLQSMPFKARALAAVTLDDNEIYVFGGFQGSKGLVTTIRFKNGHFAHINEMPSPRGGATASLFGNQSIIIAGGAESDKGKPSRETFIFEPRTQSWSLGPLLRKSRKYASTRTISGVAFVCGGIDEQGMELASCESFDGKEWVQVTDMPGGRSKAGAEVAEGKLLVQGGEAGGRLLDDIIEYDPLTKTWTNVGTMRLARSGGVTLRAAMTSSIFSIGGRVAADYAPHPEIFEYK